MLKKQKFEEFDRKSRPRPFQTMFPGSDSFAFFVERRSMDTSYIFWNKFQDCQVIFISTDYFW